MPPSTTSPSQKKRGIIPPAPLSAPFLAPFSAPLPAPFSAPFLAPFSAPLPAPLSAPFPTPLPAPLSALSPAPRSAPLPAPFLAPLSTLSPAPLSAPLPAPFLAPFSASFRALLPALFLLLLFFAAGCSSVRKNYPKIPSTALPAPAGASITRRIDAQLARHPAGHSGFRLLALSSEALTARIALADQAVSSLDIQYYMIHDDPTGRLVIQHLLAAAARGVRVRILIDDIHVAGNDRNILALDAHPNIEVRIFNPFKIRQTFALTIATQFLLDGRRLNRRMHNKSYIIDSQVAIIGGRNIGDEYFDARQDVNFRDLDLLAVGPIVKEITGSFDQFWNSDAAYPLEAFYKHANTSKELNRLRA
ncbi:MAG: phospholipase D-like domain-containing protein, partial [Opitutaceae bacterium]|nr:phospholipase D-like domain-containing protein [Opitutaceae bacterium]